MQRIVQVSDIEAFARKLHEETLLDESDEGIVKHVAAMVLLAVVENETAKEAIKLTPYLVTTQD